MSLSEQLASRAIGQYPISIATSLAIESICGIYPEAPVTPAPVLKYQELWVNIRTLYRNLMGSLPTEVGDSIPGDMMMRAISEEMAMIQEVIEGVNNRLKVVYYYSNYRDMEKKYKYAVIRKDNTEKQREYTAYQNLIMKHLLESHRGMIQGFDLKLHPHTRVPKTLILTHIPYDLVSAKEFEHLTLLESRTGALKEKAQWYTKYLNGSELAQIPFREDFLQVFGDSQHFRPMDIKLRREILDVAARYNWSQVTTRDKIVYSIEQIKNPLSREVLKSIIV